MQARMAAVGAVALALGAGLATLALSPLAVAPSRVCNSPAEAMSRLELLFGMGRKDGREVGEDEWRSFLDTEVTPRFPDGLTVLTGYGQWRSASGALSKETSRVLVIWAKPAPDSQARVEAIREAWKKKFQQESVMRVDSASCVSF
jgi:hypothetical protein